MEPFFYSEQINQKVQHVFYVMDMRVGDEDMRRIKEAYALASVRHHEQTRRSGEPYITHPIAVATIAAEELELDANTVCAAFLHDVVEDTPTTIEEIREMFGDDVAFLVGAVTKPKKEKFENTKQVDNFKQILESVHYDIRALLVKLSDRLHNMRTLESMKADKQMKIAGETDFFYAPLAGRLGLYHVKSELENLSFKFRCPRDYKTIENELNEDKIRTQASLNKFIAKIEELLKAKGLTARTQVRYRQPYSIWRDMQEKGCDFNHVDFKHYVRVIYEPTKGWEDPERDTAFAVYSALAKNFKERPGSISNYIDDPKDNGYQSFHVKILNSSGVWEEIHIGSERMHINAKLGCIVERGETWLERFRTVLQDLASNSDGYLFMEGVSSSLYNEDIIAFTPKGKGIILPQGATAVDFAFELHSNIGEHAQYARINGQLSPLRTELHRGDCVEIGVREDIHPTEYWLNFAKSYKAKKLIRESIRRGPKHEFHRCPICAPLPGDEVIGFIIEKETYVHRRYCPEAIKMSSENGGNLMTVDFKEHEAITYPISIKVTAVDRYHLFRDIIDCFVEEQHIPIDSFNAKIDDQIVDCHIEFPVHSAKELEEAISSISKIPNIEEVHRIK